MKIDTSIVRDWIDTIKEMKKDLLDLKNHLINEHCRTCKDQKKFMGRKCDCSIQGILDMIGELEE